MPIIFVAADSFATKSSVSSRHSPTGEGLVSRSGRGKLETVGLGGSGGADSESTGSAGDTRLLPSVEDAEQDALS